MTLVIAWIVLPLVLSLLSLGCGLLLETASGMRLPGALLLPGGFIVISLATQFAHMFDFTAQLQTPLVVLLAVAGYWVGRPWERFNLDRWLTGSVVGVFAVFAAPVVLSGRATFLGYVRLDDTAFYQSMLDRARTAAYDINGVPRGTYHAALNVGYKFGYPLGSLLPLDVGNTLLRVDTMWLWQSYLSFLALLTALGLYQLASGLIESRPLRACVAFIGAQPALYYGYAAWGGVKELFLPSVVIFAVCLVPRLREGGPRQAIPIAAASAAVIGGWSVGGGIWLLPFLGAGLIILLTSRPLNVVLNTIGVYLLATGFLAIPILSVSEKRLGVPQKFLKGSGGEKGNLIRALGWDRLGGSWFSGDFRFKTPDAGIVHLLLALVVIAVITGAVFAVRRRAWEIVTLLVTALFACLVYVETASIWVAGKSLASASPLVLGVALVGVAVVIETGLKLTTNSRAILAGGGALVLALIAAGVLWSNATQYHAVLFAPQDRQMELEKIGAKFSGQGPTLLTEYEAYAARHFLRGMGAETPSELRTHYDYLRNGTYAQTGVSPDIDEIRLDQIHIYKLLIIRRTGIASRPPSDYDVIWSGRYYDVWKRNFGAPQIIDHLSLGSRFQPAAVPACSAVMHLAHLARAAHGVLATVYRQPAIVIEPNGHLGPPAGIGTYGEPYGLSYSTKPFKYVYPFTVPSSGQYRVWVGGSFSSTLTARVDGYQVGQQSNQTEWPGNFLNFGAINLRRGTHYLVIKHDGPSWGPGTAARQSFGLGPFALSTATDKSPVSYVHPKNARSLCGKSLDWVEALSG